MGPEYHKIVTVFRRNPETNFKTLIDGSWATQEFDYLQDASWTATEKVDGTNIRVSWDGQTVEFGGKTDNAQIPAHLANVLKNVFTVERLSTVFGPIANRTFTLYGEGYGAKIQKGGGLYRPDQGIILFDVLCQSAMRPNTWLERTSVADIASAFNIPVVPQLRSMTLRDAVQMVKLGFDSLIAEQTRPAEGLVLRPAVELSDRLGYRIITKIKTKDFRHEEAA